MRSWLLAVAASISVPAVGYCYAAAASLNSTSISSSVPHGTPGSVCDGSVWSERRAVTLSTFSDELLMTVERAMHFADVWPSDPIHVGTRGKDGDGQQRYWPQKRGNPKDAQYFWRKKSFFVNSFNASSFSSKRPVIVFLLPADVAAFIRNVFMALPSTARVILITGKADCGAPLELFTGGLRYEHPPHFVFNDGKRTTESRLRSMIDFILDERLVHWYAQNFDMLGCGAFTGNSPIDANHPVAKKISMLPIGGEGLYRLSCTEVEDLRLRHFSKVNQSYDETARSKGLLSWGGHRDVASRSELNISQQVYLDALGSNTPWQQRKLTILSSCGAGSNFKIGRAAAIAAVSKQPQSSAVIMPTDKKKLDTLMNLTRRFNVQNSGSEVGPETSSPRNMIYFRSVTEAMFVLCPPGHGMDTHRFWQALTLGSVPVVLASSLDWLLEQYPTIILQSWKEIEASDALTKWKAVIEERWGKEPFSDEVRRRLTVGYFRDAIREGRRLHGSAPPRHFFSLKGDAMLKYRNNDDASSAVGSSGDAKWKNLSLALHGSYPTCNLPSCSSTAVGEIYSRAGVSQCRKEALAWGAKPRNTNRNRINRGKKEKAHESVKLKPRNTNRNRINRGKQKKAHQSVKLNKKQKGKLTPEATEKESTVPSALYTYIFGLHFVLGFFFLLVLWYGIYASCPW